MTHATLLSTLAVTSLLTLLPTPASAQNDGVATPRQQHQQDGRGGRQQHEQQRRQQEANALKVGQLAPTFVLDAIKPDEGAGEGERTFDLAEFKGKKPVIMFFGSYT
ncbi:MAG: hypothetical protein ACR2GY_08675 [Phycisphaerales bacterium]